MAENINTTISRPAPYLEAAGETLLDLTTGLTGKPIDTSQFAPSVAGQNVLTQQAQQQAATQGGLGTLQFNQQGAISSTTIHWTNCLSRFYVSLSDRCYRCYFI